MSNSNDKSMTNLIYAAIVVLIGSIGYLAYKNIQKNRAAGISAEVAAAPTNGLSSASDSTLGGAAMSSSAQANATQAISPDQSALGDVPTGTVVKGGTATTTTPATYDTKATKPTEPSKVRELSLESENGNGGNSDKLSSKGKSPKVAATKASTKPKYYTTAGDKGDYMVVAGSFTSKVNADAQVTALKKGGFKFAEAVKMGNSVNNVVIAARYPYRGGAEATVRDLAKKKIKAYVKKKEGDVYKSEAATTAPIGSK